MLNKMYKSMLTFIVLLLIAPFFATPAVNAEVDGNYKETIVLTPEEMNAPNLDQFTLETLDNLREYVTVDENGMKTFNEKEARANGEPGYMIDIGTTMNQLVPVPDSKMSPNALLVYGNYCGFGNSGGTPIDDLDYACQQHDACYAWLGNNTQCNNEFRARLLPIIQVTQEFTLKWNVAVAAYELFS